LGVAGAVEAAQVTDKVEAEELAANLTRAKNVKAKMVAAMGEANDLVTSVATQSEWKWADTEQSVGKLNTIMNEIAALKTSSKMWKDWVTTDHKQWVVMMKKQFLPSVTVKELAKIEDFEKTVNMLSAQIAKMKNMQALMNADQEI
jgi:hypothetical protein